jgi:pimeloyl-ACP methyl ester carboxylesterase
MENDMENINSNPDHPQYDSLKKYRSARRRVAYRRFGRNDQNVLILWHVGWFASMQTTWEFLSVLHTLAAKFECVLYDRAGVGESMCNVGSTPRDRALDVADVIRDCNLEASRTKIVHIGLSEGGSAALEFASLFKDYTDGLILVGTTPKWVQSKPEGWMHALNDYDKKIIENSVINDVNTPIEKRMGIWCRRMYGLRRNEKNPINYSKLAKSFAKDIGNNNSRVQEIYHALAEYDALCYMKSIQVPTLVLHGGKDLIQHEGARILSASMQCSHIQIFPESMHGIWWENRDEFTSEVNKFVTNLLSNDRLFTTDDLASTSHPYRAKLDFQNSAKTVDPDLCAVMLQTKPKKRKDEVFSAVSKAVSGIGMTASRVVDLDEPGQIAEEAFELISKASIVIADISELNANVMYEVGVCDAWGKTVILIAYWPPKYKIPMYLNNRRIIGYDSKTGLSDSFKQKIISSIQKNRADRGLDSGKKLLRV